MVVLVVSIIVAMTEDRVIGKNNDLPWPRIKEDMKHFKDITAGHAVVMGRKTWDSIPEKFKPLPGRTNIVVSRQKDLQLPGAHVYNNIYDALKAALEKDSEPMVIGGNAIYEAALPYTKRIYLSLIKQDFEGDTYFPELKTTDWNETVLFQTDKAVFKQLNRA